MTGTQANDDGYVAPDWAALIDRGSVDELAAAVARGIAAGDPVATGIGTEGVELLRAAERQIREAKQGDLEDDRKIRSFLRLFLL